MFFFNWMGRLCNPKLRFGDYQQQSNYSINCLSDKRPPISKRRLMQTWYYDKEGFYLSHAVETFPWGNIIARQIHFSPELETSFTYAPQSLAPACEHCGVRIGCLDVGTKGSIYFGPPTSRERTLEIIIGD